MLDDQFGCHSDNVEAIFLQALASMISWEHGPRAIRDTSMREVCEESTRGFCGGHTDLWRLQSDQIVTFEPKRGSLWIVLIKAFVV